MSLEPHHGLHRTEIGDLSRRVPGGARGQLVAFDQGDVGEAFASKVVERATAGDTAADNRDANM